MNIGLFELTAHFSLSGLSIAAYISALDYVVLCVIHSVRPGLTLYQLEHVQ